MFKGKENYRQFETTRLIFKEVLAGRPETLPHGGIETHTQIIRSLPDRLEVLRKNYGEETYKKTIQEQADKIIPPPQDERVQQILADSVRRYMQRFNEIETEFIKKSQALEQAYTEAEREIERKTQEELSILKTSIKEAEKLSVREKEALPDVNDKREMNRHFGNYLSALEEHYFKGEIKEISAWDYGSEGRKFQEKMEIWVQTQLNVIRQDKGGINQYKTFKENIGKRYETYANFDKNPATISSLDLQVLNKNMQFADEKIEAIPEKIDPKDPNYQRYLRKMEDARMMNPEGWKYSMILFGRNIIKRAENDGLKKKFTAEVSEKIEKIEPKNEKADFQAAKKIFLKRIEDLSQRGVEVSINFVQNFNETIFGSTLNPEKNLAGLKSNDKAYVDKVKHELDILMSGTFTAEKATDLTLVRFMRGGVNERRNMLSHPAMRQELFRAIKAATEAYPEIYKTKYASVNGESKNPNPFRLQALIILGEQAKGIVENYSPTFSTQLEKVKFDPKNVSASTKFRPTLVTTPKFRSALHRGGFNTRDIGLSALKVFGIITMGINFSQDMYNNKGENNLLLRMAKAGVTTLSNPGFLIGAGATYLAHKAESNPRYLKWPWLSEDEKEDIHTAEKLEKIGSRTSIEKRDRLLGNPVEWKLAKKLKENPDQFTKVMEMASSERKPGKFTGISPDLLVKAGVLDKTQDADIYYNLSQNSNKTRYQFYNEFLRGDNVDVHQVKEKCTGSSFIS